MKHLSGLDATFLHFETPEMPMHVGSLHVLDLPPDHQGDFFEDAKRHVAERLHLADVFTRKLVLMPFDLSNPVWVEDDDVDLDYHVRHITLPKPGSNRQLQQLVARLHSTALDRSRPMWEFFVIDGLRSGQVGLYLKVHHAGIDGQAGVAFANAAFDKVASGRVIPPARARRATGQLGMAELATAAVRNAAEQYIKLFKMAPAAWQAMLNTGKALEIPAASDLVAPLAAAGRVQGAEKGAAKTPDWRAPRTPFNVQITNQRNWIGRTTSLADAKRAAKRFGVSVNDVVMSATSGALRRYLNDHGELPAQPLIAGVPVSLRTPGDETANNQVSAILVNLHSDVDDTLQRLMAVKESSNWAKSAMNRFKAVIPNDFPVFGAPWLMTGMASLLGRSGLVDKLQPVANVIISNVPGIQQPLYFAGASVSCYYPVSIPSHGMALNVTVESYNGRLDYGLIACRRAVPDLELLGDYLLNEHQRLVELAREADSADAGNAPGLVQPVTKAAPKKTSSRTKRAGTATPRTTRKQR